jgi:hypothetical protein
MLKSAIAKLCVSLQVVTGALLTRPQARQTATLTAVYSRKTKDP